MRCFFIVKRMHALLRCLKIVSKWISTIDTGAHKQRVDERPVSSTSCLCAPVLYQKDFRENQSQAGEGCSRTKKCSCRRKDVPAHVLLKRNSQTRPGRVCSFSSEHWDFNLLMPITPLHGHKNPTPYEKIEVLVKIPFRCQLNNVSYVIYVLSPSGQNLFMAVVILLSSLVQISMVVWGRLFRFLGVYRKYMQIMSLAHHKHDNAAW